MTLRLLILRHAKSSWAEPGRDDRDRPLNDRGHKTAPLIGKFMRKQKLVPDLVLCSPARRAKDTLKLALKALQNTPTIQFEEEIYGFGDGSSCLETIRSQGTDASKLLIVGHNPSLHDLASRLAGAGNEDSLLRLKRKFPTAALAVLDFDAKQWSDIAWGEGRLELFVTPKSLENKN